jgi:uncharacterized membrane protein (UPF0136 family)
MVFVLILYALLILVGGIIGHLKAGSLMSLLTGLICGLILLGSALAIRLKKPWGIYVALVTTLLLDLFFTYRFLATYKFMPSGFLSLLSLSVLVLIIRSIKR